MESCDSPSRYTYVHKGCRCEECTKANANYKRNKAADNLRLTAATTASLSSEEQTVYDPKLTHGLPSTYEWHGCRCPRCTGAFSKRQRNYRLLRELESLT